MNRIFAGIFFLFLTFHCRAAIPFFYCDSVLITSINVNQVQQRIEIVVHNTSHGSFTWPEMTGVLVNNSYLTIGTMPGQSGFLEPCTGPNGGYTGFAIHFSSFTPAANVPAGTAFTGTVTLYNPNDLSVSCDYPVSFTYGTGPVGIETHASLLTLNAFPNPATEYITLEENDEGKTFFIYDCIGNLVLTSDGNRVDISGLPAGTYFFRQEERTGKFVKQ